MLFEDLASADTTDIQALRADDLLLANLDNLVSYAWRDLGVYQLPHIDPVEAHADLRQLIYVCTRDRLARVLDRCRELSGQRLRQALVGTAVSVIRTEVRRCFFCHVAPIGLSMSAINDSDDISDSEHRPVEDRLFATSHPDMDLYIDRTTCSAPEDQSVHAEDDYDHQWQLSDAVEHFRGWLAEPSYRALRMRVVDGISVPLIADLLGCTTQNVHLCLRGARDVLSEYVPDPSHGCTDTPEQ